jgi:hypothetical protein
MKLLCSKLLYIFIEKHHFIASPPSPRCSAAPEAEEQTRGLPLWLNRIGQLTKAPTGLLPILDAERRKIRQVKPHNFTNI